MNGTPAHTSLYITQHKDDPDHAALLTRFWTVTITCEWCGEPFHHTMAAGQKPKYCSQSCRTESRLSYFRNGSHYER